MSVKKRAHLRIYGRVQGVFYRKTSQQKARELLLTGWVKNLSDGSVELVAEGKEDNIRKLIEWCHEGPSRADVDRIEVTWEDYTGEYNDFTIEYI